MIFGGTEILDQFSPKKIMEGITNRSSFLAFTSPRDILTSTTILTAVGRSTEVQYSAGAMFTALGYSKEVLLMTCLWFNLVTGNHNPFAERCVNNTEPNPNGR